MRCCVGNRRYCGVKLDFDEPLDVDIFIECLKDAEDILRQFSSQVLGEFRLIDLIVSVKVFGTKAAFDRAVFSEEKVPRSFVGVADGNVLKLVSPDVFREVFPDSSDFLGDYSRLIAHELIHRLHVHILNGAEQEMGPIWFFEGIAIVGSGQYPDAPAADREEVMAILSSSNVRGNYSRYGAALRFLLRSFALPDLIESARHDDFSEKILRAL